MKLDGATALVTGANRGIGRAIAEALAREPLALLLAGARDPGAMEPLAAPAGGAREVRAVAVDLASRESIERSCTGLPEIDLLINNAGRMTGGLLEDQDLDDVYAMFQVNLVGVTQLTRAVLPGMLGRGRGKIVNNASISGYAYFPRPAPTPRPRPASSPSASRSGESSRAPASTCSSSSRRACETEMVDATLEAYGRHMDTSAWDLQPAEEWAAKVVKAIRSDDAVLGPGGRLAIAKLASRGPAALLDAIVARSFSRRPRN